MYVIGTAGHVDHGKSLLVEALTGIDPDRLREEKARGMTIDLGFAWLTLPSGRTTSIVDVPGHERFIKNMLAGAGGIDLALLVVAADDGVMPQTREHLAILDLLDVRRGVVALTKRDLVDPEWLCLVERDVVETLAPTTLASSPVVACSAVTREGLSELLHELDAAIGDLPSKRDIARPRLPIDRVFTISGFGTVVTGTLIDGALNTGCEVEVVPGELRGRVRTLQSHRDTLYCALPGTRTAVNVSGIAKDELRRGMVLTTPAWLKPATALDVQLRAVRDLARPLRHNMKVTFHSGADEANATVRLLDATQLFGGDSGWAQIRLETAVAVAAGDRFVVRTANETVGGGTIVDVVPKRHRRGDKRVLAALESMLSEDPAERVGAIVARRPMIRRDALAAESGLEIDRFEQTLAALVQAAALVPVDAEGSDGRFATKSYLDGLAHSAVAEVAAYHRAHRLRRGMPQQELRERLRLNPGDFDVLAPGWRDVVIADGLAHLAGFAPGPTAEEEPEIAAYVARLRSARGSNAPTTKPGAHVFAYLVETGVIVDAEGVVFDRAEFDNVTARIAEYIRAHGQITLAQARDLMGTGRKQAQALLEELDRRKVTRRVGDTRVLR